MRSPVRRFLAPVLVAVITAPLLLAGTTTRHHNGPIKVETIERQSPVQHYVVARIDLTDPRVQIAVASAGPDPDGAGPWETTLQPTSTIARVNDFDLAINTVFFSHQPLEGNIKKYAIGEPAASQDLVVIDGRPASPKLSGVLLAFDKENRPSIQPVRGAVPPNVWQAASGSMQIVTNGRNTAGDSTAVHPRTAAGIADDGKTLVLFVADGRRKNWGTGLTLSQLAEEMIKLGCRDALNFDGGGSTTLVQKTEPGKFKVLNTPSDGSDFILPLSVERPVPYVLGVKLKSE